MPTYAARPPVTTQRPGQQSGRPPPQHVHRGQLPAPSPRSSAGSPTGSPPPVGSAPSRGSQNPRSAAARAAEARRQAARAAASRAADRRTAIKARARADFAEANAAPSIARSSVSMMIPTLISRMTGFARQLLLAAVLGLSAGSIFDSYNIANTLPTKINELLIGGVLTSVAVPVLVRAHKEDADGGQEYTQRLITMAIAWMGIATLICTAGAPLLTKLFVDSSTGQSNPTLVTAFNYLLLPEIFFYALSALVSSILNAKNVFKPTVWAPVVNNVIVILTGLFYLAVPGQISLNPVRMGNAKLLVLGVGTTLGIVAQAVVMVPALYRSGFRFKWRWGIDSRLKDFGELALWVLGYVGISQIGLLVLDRVSTAAAPGTVSIYQNTWLLVQLPYGVIGFSLLTAIMPRMSRNAADGNNQAVIDDLSFGNRMSTVLLGPISGLMTILGPQIGLALFSIKGGADATRLGLTLTASAFGLLPYTITLVQTRVFYAMKDARTPTLIMLAMVVARIPLSYLCPVILDPAEVVYGLAAVNSLCYVVGAVAGQIWLRRKLGALNNWPVLVTIGKTVVASAWGAAATLAVIKLLHALAPGASRTAMSWPALILGSAVGLVATLGLMHLLRVSELKPAVNRIRRLLGR